jgi:hypothetical protein
VRGLGFVIRPLSTTHNSGAVVVVFFSNRMTYVNHEKWGNLVIYINWGVPKTISSGVRFAARKEQRGLQQKRSGAGNVER